MGMLHSKPYAFTGFQLNYSNKVITRTTEKSSFQLFFTSTLSIKVEKQTINKVHVKFLPLPKLLSSRSIFRMTSQHAHQVHLPVIINKYIHHLLEVTARKYRQVSKFLSTETVHP